LNSLSQFVRKTAPEPTNTRQDRSVTSELMRMPKKRILKLTAAVVGAFALLLFVWMAATVARLKLPAPTGPYCVGRMRLTWEDDQRHERYHPERHREVIAEVWYPAKEQTGRACPYFPELEVISGELTKSGQITSLQATGLAWIASHAMLDAEFAEVDKHCPVILLSPGNSTNVEFYSVYGEELASRGFVVFGVNHPYDVTGVRLRDGSVATYRERPPGDKEALTARMAERSADVRFLVDCLAALNNGDGRLAQHLDLSKIGIMGHSLGGMTAAESCTADPRLLACINVDGLHAGNPYAARPDGLPPPQPFMYIGKDRTISSGTAKLIADNPRGSLVSVPEARHMDFADVSLFEPALNPFDGRAYRVLTRTRHEAAEFFERWLPVR
jgi:pimeloyl-ACP methyl ester carboxylesterase